MYICIYVYTCICARCGNFGHGQGDCTMTIVLPFSQPSRPPPPPPPPPTDSSKRPVSAVDSAFGGDGQGATASTDSSAASTNTPRKSTRTSKLESPIELMIWRPTELNLHGFACLFQFSCSMMNRSCEERKPLYIDLNHANSLYASFTAPGSRQVGGTISFCNRT